MILDFLKRWIQVSDDPSGTAPRLRIIPEPHQPRNREVWAGEITRITTLTLTVVIGPLDIQAVAAESVVSIQPRDLPSEYVPTISSPQVNDPTSPGWSLPLRSADTTAGFRLTGVDQQDETEVQRKLFLASAAAGTAGGGLV